MTANFVSAGFGFLFWTPAARLYQDVGFASAVISAVGLLAMLSALGLDYALSGSSAEPGAEQRHSSSLTIASAGALALAVVFIGGLGVWSSALFSIREPRGRFGRPDEASA